MSPWIQHVIAELPVVLGRDLSGVVDQVGAEVTQWQVGDPVWAAVPFWRPGTLAEFVVLEEKEVRHAGAWSREWCPMHLLDVLCIHVQVILGSF